MSVRYGVFLNFTLPLFGGVAQLGERTVRIRKVESSILFVSTKIGKLLTKACRFYFDIKKPVAIGFDDSNRFLFRFKTIKQLSYVNVKRK